jgi:aspartyl-tRNA(Asn)/glutamyl-tRNA(Gln) amidotransferase subunit A
VSRHGLVAHASSLDTIGVIAGDVDDAAAVLRAIAGPDGLDSTVAEFAHPIEMRPAERVAILRLEPQAVSADVASNLDEVTDALRGAGVEVREARLPSLAPALAAYVVLAAAETASNLARYDGKLYGARVEGPSYEESVARTRAAGFGEEVKLRILLGTEVLRQGHTANALGRAKALVARLRTEFEELFAGTEAILMPTVPTTAFELGSRTSDPLSMRDADRFTVGPSLVGLPAVAVPSGEGQDRAPLSVQCVAARGREDLALGLASQVEQLSGVDRWREESWWPRTERATP